MARIETGTKSTRQFLLLGPEGRNLDVRTGFDRHFSVTSQRGANHEQILAAAPPEVVEDLATLVSLHLCDADGVPMHAVANAAYHILNEDYDAAVRSLGVGATMDDVMGVVRHKALAITQEGGDALGKARDAIRQAADRVAVCSKRVSQDRTDGRSFIDTSNLHAALLNFRAALSAMEPEVPVGSRPSAAQRTAGKKLEDGGWVDKALAVAASGLGEKSLTALRQTVGRKLVDEGVRKLASERLAPSWSAAAAKGREILDKPDFRLAARPEPDRDPRTFRGFATLNGLSLSTNRSWRTGREGSERNWWNVTLAHEGTGETYVTDFMGPTKPDVETLLESFQTDISFVTFDDMEAYIEGMGVSDLKSVRDGEKAYAGSVEEGRSLRSMLGPEAFKALMTDVGDDPPVSPEAWNDDVFLGPEGTPAP